MNPGTPTVFVVDDDASYLRSITRLLRASGFTVAGFPSAEAFLADLHADAAGCVRGGMKEVGLWRSEIPFSSVAFSSSPSS